MRLAAGKTGGAQSRSEERWMKNEKRGTKYQRHPLDVCNFHKKFNTSAARELQQFPGVVQIKSKKESRELKCTNDADEG